MAKLGYEGIRARCATTRRRRQESRIVICRGELAGCVDDLCFIHSMYAKSNNHTPATFQMNSGFTMNGFPSMGAWLSYGLGTENENLPAFVVLPDPRGLIAGGSINWTAGFLPANHQGKPNLGRLMGLVKKIVAAEGFCEMYTPLSPDHIRKNPERFLEHTVPYITVRTLHRLEETLKRQETALKSLEADSRWIKWFAIITGVLTLVLVFLTIVLAKYASHLDTVMQPLQSKQLHLVS